MHYYKHSIGDYRRDTMHLTLLEHGVYRQLLDLYYLNECELDANALRLVCARDADEIRAGESILNEFFVKTETGWKHTRCDKEIAEYYGKSEKAKASADARWKGKDKSKTANAMRTHSEGNANHKPITNNHKPVSKATRLPSDWIAPQNYIDYCNAKRPDLNANDVAVRFRNYWVAKPSDATKLDWWATWQNWVMNEKAVKTDQQPKKSKLDEWANAPKEKVINA